MSTPHGAPRSGQDRWLVSYADFITLLFAFFTVMYAASNVDATKLAPLASSLSQAFAGENGAARRTSGDKPSLVAPVEVLPSASNLEDLRLRLSTALENDIRARNVDITRDLRGLVVSLPERSTFDVGSADVTPDTRDLIERVIRPLQGLPNAIRIEGHTDDVPIRTPKYASNWELSSARASAVIAQLLQSTAIEPARLSAAGYGEFHPRGPNDSPAGRARNRRIDIVVLDSAGPDPQAAGQP